MPEIVRTGARLSDLLGRLVENSMKSTLVRSALSEKENQEATSQALSGSSDSGDDDALGLDDGSGDEGDSSKTMDADAEELKSGDVSFDNIVAKLNAIRSGKSFRDDNIRHAMEAYVQSLKKAERVALLAFLKGIAQIVTGEVDGQQAVDPADPEPDVAMTKAGTTGGDGSSPSPKEKGGGERRSIKPNVIKRTEPTKKKPSAEDTTAPVPVPIKPKTKQK